MAFGIADFEVAELLRAVDAGAALRKESRSSFSPRLGTVKVVPSNSTAAEGRKGTTTSRAKASAGHALHDVLDGERQHLGTVGSPRPARASRCTRRRSNRGVCARSCNRPSSSSASSEKTSTSPIFALPRSPTCPSSCPARRAAACTAAPPRSAVRPPRVPSLRFEGRRAPDAGRPATPTPPTRPTAHTPPRSAPPTQGPLQFPRWYWQTHRVTAPGDGLGREVELCTYAAAPPRG